MSRIAIAIMIGMLWLGGSSCHRRVMQAKKDIAYSESSNATTYTETPYGSLVIPGKWESGKYTRASGHQYLYRSDTSTLVAAIGACRSLPFGKERLAGYDVVTRYYDLEKRYQDMQGQATTILLEDKEKKYMLWMARIDGIDQYFLFGIKDGSDKECTYRMLDLKTRKVNKDAAMQFLQGIFLNDN